MSLRISADKNQPSAAIEIPLMNPLPDYDLHQMEQPTPRDIDALLVSQGFRDLVDDARGVLTELVAKPPPLPNSSLLVDLDLTQIPHFEIVQLTGAICPGDGEVYLPGLWIILRDVMAPQKASLSEIALEHVHVIIAALMHRLGLT
ncbi:MAG TPA: hypothetical protein VN830_08005 [Verrucomicrobiae bacterium]|nr:hypothetical protein [Verrucomicrobiae bacterium]